jgi:hypothetical protein
LLLCASSSPFADIVHLSYDLEGTNTNQDYIVGLGATAEMLLIKFSGAVYTHWILDVSVSGDIAYVVEMSVCVA